MLKTIRYHGLSTAHSTFLSLSVSLSLSLTRARGRAAKWLHCAGRVSMEMQIRGINIRRNKYRGKKHRGSSSAETRPLSARSPLAPFFSLSSSRSCKLSETDCIRACEWHKDASPINQRR